MKKIYLTLVVGLFLVPTILISQTVSISGQVTRHNGDAVPDVDVSCGVTITTDMNGNFEIADIPVGYSCEMIASGDFDKFEDVTILDVVAARLHILAIDDFDYYQFLASDVNNNQALSALDLVRMMQLALRIDNNVSDEGIFIDADYDFTMPNSTNPSVISINAADTITDANFIAIKKGDPAISSDYTPAPSSAPSPIFTISDEVLQVGQEVEFKITVDDFENIIGSQQTFKWDPNVLEFQSIESLSGVNVEINDGEITQGLLPTLSPIEMFTVQNGDVIMSLKFIVLADVPASTEVLFFTDDITERQVIWQNPIDQELFIVDGEYMNGETTTSIISTPKGLESFQVFPNPVEENIHVKALLGNAEDFEIAIVNILGQLVFSKNFDEKELLLEIDFGKFPAGTYFLSLKTADGIQTESFVKKSK